MARIRIDLPERFDFETEITLYQSHMNYGNHLDNALLLTVVSEARLRFLKSMGHTELDVDGAGIIVSDAALQYLSEAHHGETLTVGIAARDFNKYGCDLLWQMREVISGREVARGKTGIVFFDYQHKKITRVPAAFAARFAPSPATEERPACAASDT